MTSCRKMTARLGRSPQHGRNLILVRLFVALALIVVLAAAASVPPMYFYFHSTNETIEASRSEIRRAGVVLGPEDDCRPATVAVLDSRTSS